MKANASFELDKVLICPDLGRFLGHICLEISPVEDCALAFFAKPHIDTNEILGRGLFRCFGNRKPLE
jgi:hypothetical protein